MKHYNLLLSALVMVASYALQRLLDAQSEPPIGTVLMQATIPYYWRASMAVVHGLMALFIAEALQVTLEPPAWMCTVVVLLSAAAMVMVP